MNESKDWLVGLQVYAYDVNEEGARAIVDAALEIGANTIFVAISYLDRITSTEEDRSPRLFRNPVRKHHGVEAYIHPTFDRYPTKLIPPVGDDPGLDGDQAYQSLRQAAEPFGITVIPWILFLHQKIAEQAPETQVVNAAGKHIPGWLCPSRAETHQFVKAIVEDIIERHHPPAIFIDGVRYPEPNPSNLMNYCTCFCEACFSEASARGIDLEPIRLSLFDQVNGLTNNAPYFIEESLTNLSSGFRVLRTSATQSGFLDWFRFRHAMIERVIASIKQATQGRTELWLDVWPPTYGWLLGQDLSMLAPYSYATRPFTYHQIGGGADIPGLIRSIVRDPASQQSLYQIFRGFFNFPGPASFEEFLSRGLDPKFITVESVFAKQLLSGHSKMLAGLQIWHVGVDGVRSALEHALLAKPDGVVLHCYGWATSDEIRAAGDWIKNQRHL